MRGALGLVWVLRAVGCASGVVVDLQGLGRVEGVSRGDGVDAFLGVPYAAAPVGALRFRPAEAPAPWTGTRDASTYGPPCLQSPSGDPNEAPDPEAPPPSEDCLYLNVWAPQNRSSSSLPVMLWIHGGGFCSGAGSERWFDGGRLAREGGGAIVATTNYRLGPLGFLVTDAETGSGGMNGIRDLVAALEFLNQHATAFGGDPDRVTIFGQSAGAMATCVLGVSPLAAGLAARAIVESGPCVDPDGWGPGSAARGNEASKLVFEALNATTLDDLRRVKNASQIQWSSRDMDDFTFPGYFVDAAVVPAHPGVLYATGAPRTFDEMLLGVNSRDGTAQYYGQVPYVTNASNGNFSSQMDARWGDRSAAVKARYDPATFNGSVQAAVVAADSDAIVACPSRRRRVALSRVSRESRTKERKNEHPPLEGGTRERDLDERETGPLTRSVAAR